MTSVHFSLVADLRCAPRADAAVEILRNSIISTFRDHCAAAAVRGTQRLEAAGLSIAVYGISGVGTASLLPWEQCTAQSIVHIEECLARALAQKPCVVRGATDPLVLQGLAVRTACDAVTDTATEGHVVLLATTLGPGTNGHSLVRLLPAGARVPTTLTVVLASPHPNPAVASDVFLTGQVRVVRPRVDARGIVRAVVPVFVAGLRASPVVPVALRLGGATTTASTVSADAEDDDQAPRVGSTSGVDGHAQPLVLGASCAALVDDAGSDWLRNLLIAAPDAGHVELMAHAMVAAASISESWLCGVPAVLRVHAVGAAADAAQGRRRVPADVAGDADVLSAVCRALDDAGAVLVVRASCPVVSGSSKGRPWFVLLSSGSNSLLARQLIPAELRRPDVTDGAVPQAAAEGGSEEVSEATDESQDVRAAGAITALQLLLAGPGGPWDPSMARADIVEHLSPFAASRHQHPQPVLGSRSANTGVAAAAKCRTPELTSPPLPTAPGGAGRPVPSKARVSLHHVMQHGKKSVGQQQRQ